VTDDSFDRGSGGNSFFNGGFSESEFHVVKITNRKIQSESVFIFLIKSSENTLLCNVFQSSGKLFPQSAVW
jgi:hypothetical protein